MSNQSKCKYCGKDYSRENLERSLGILSPVISEGMCSSTCYTKRIMLIRNTPK